MTTSISKFKGCLLGSALGDVIGELAFRYNSREKLYSKLEETDQLKYTDDTAMAIGLAESLIENDGEIDQKHIGDTFRKNYEKEPWREYGQGPPKIFRMVENSEKGYFEAAQTLFGGEGSKGNGSAMRIAPVGILFSNDDSQYEKAVKTVEVIHTHPLGKDGAALLSITIGKAAVSEEISPQEFAEYIAHKARTEEFSYSLERVKKNLEINEEREEVAKELGTSVLIDQSVPYAIFSFLKEPSSYKDALMNAILVPGDKDTIGAMTGAISGAYLGIESLNDEWVRKLENESYLKQLAENLYDLY
ncbi:MAG: ADP-ribosylglycohydrolase family protein [Thermoplasmata archaeon]